MAYVTHPNFRRWRYPRPRRRNVLRRTVSRFQLVDLFVVIGAILLLWGSLSVGGVSSALRAPSGWLDSVRIEIIDGDTIRSGAQVYRLVGFNTPELGEGAKCPRERAVAAAARKRLHALVAGGELDLRRVPCACAGGTEGTGQCNYGRLCGTLKVRGQDVGAILIAEGLAEPYACGTASCPSRGTWCSS